MAHWLIKSEPSKWSWDQQVAAGAKGTHWDGVKNHTAKLNLMAMKQGDQVFFYHSNCAEPGIAGIARIARTGYPDPTAFDPAHPHHDPKSRPDQPTWYMVDVQLVRKLRRCITLAELKAQPELDGLALLRRGNRLSVMPVTEAQWHFILGLE